MLALKRKKEKRIYNSILSNLKRSKKMSGDKCPSVELFGLSGGTSSQTSAMMIHSPIVQSNSLLSISADLG